jgi:predicted lipoprotein
MNLKAIKYGVGIIAIALVGYNSVYFQPLDQRLSENQQTVFNASAYVDEIWNQELAKAYQDSPVLSQLIEGFKNDVESTFDKNSNALGIGNIGYFRVKGEGIVTAINENNVLLQVGNNIIEVETEFIFGNALRDASGLVKINDYENTSDFNSISEAINDRIRQDIIPEFKLSISIGDTVRFEGAMELNKVHMNLEELEIIPFTLQITS